MPNNRKIILRGPDAGDAFSAVADVYRILASDRQTGDEYSLSEIRVSPNNGPPPHILLVKTNHFLFWKARSNFRLVMKKSQPGPARSFKGREALHTVSRTTRNCPRACWCLFDPGRIREFLQRICATTRDSIAGDSASKTKSINYWRSLPKYGLQILSRANESHDPVRRKRCPRAAKQDSAPLVFSFWHGRDQSADAPCASLCFARRRARFARSALHPAVCLTTANQREDDVRPSRRNRTGR